MSAAAGDRREASPHGVAPHGDTPPRGGRQSDPPPDAGVQRLLEPTSADLLGPGERPAIAGLEIECLYRTRGDDSRSELREIDGFGGDFVDFFSPRGLAQLVVTLGDVRGKGVGAAAARSSPST